MSEAKLIMTHTSKSIIRIFVLADRRARGNAIPGSNSDMCLIEKYRQIVKIMGETTPNTSRM
jgi:hypothetical protein